MTDDATARASWRDLLERARPHRRVLVAATLLGLLGTAAALAQPLAVRLVIETLGDDGPTDLTTPVVLLGVLVLVGAGLAAVQSFLLERTAERVVRTARTRLADRLLSLRMSELDRRPPGDLLSRVTSDTTLLRAVTTSTLVETLNSAVTLVGAVVLMAVLDLVLLGVTLGALVVVAVGVGVILPRIGRATERAQQAVGEVSSTLERALGAIRTVRASGATQREQQAIADAAERAYQQGVTGARYSAVTSVGAGLSFQLAFLVVLVLGGARVAGGLITVADLIAFLLYLFALGQPIGTLTNAASQLQEGLAALRRLQELERLPIEDEPGPVPAVAIGADGPLVRFDDVRFQYRPEGPPVLRGVSFVVPRAGQTAIVGPSGAGKTTLFALLERFYEPDGGRILLDGVDLRDLARGQVRATLGYVEQDAPALAGTLWDNLRYAAPDADDDAVREVVRTARLDGLVARLPDGLDTDVGPRGVTLSGGERQRLALARALLRRPRLLLLDEATAQLDAVNEQALRDVVDDIALTRAVLVIAHRLSTVVAAPRIVVLEAGQVRAVGTHLELLQRDALYAELAATQLLPATEPR